MEQFKQLAKDYREKMEALAEENEQLKADLKAQNLLVERHEEVVKENRRIIDLYSAVLDELTAFRESNARQEILIESLKQELLLLDSTDFLRRRRDCSYGSNARVFPLDEKHWRRWPSMDSKVEKSTPVNQSASHLGLRMELDQRATAE